MDLKSFFLVFMGGGAGSSLRFLLTQLLNKPHGFPFGTLLANLLACLILGYFSLARPTSLEPSFRIFCLIGLTGGLSTFSTWILETHRFIIAGQSAYAAANIVFSLAIGLAILRLISLGESIG